MALFTGLSAFPVTPADADGRVDTGAVRHLVRRMVEAGVGSIGVLGSTGCAPYFDRKERRRAIEAAVTEAAAGASRVPVMAGIGALATADVLRLARDAAECGADALLLPPLCYIPLTDDEVVTLFETVAGAVPLPICIYNNPANTHFTVSAALVARLSRIATVAAVKNPAPEPADMASALIDLRRQVPDGFSLGASIDARAAEALLAGADAWYSVLAGTLPHLCVPLANAAQAGDAATARTLNAALQPVWDLFAAHTSLRVIYAMVNLLGISHAQPPPPVQPLAKAPRRAVAAMLAAMGTL